MTNFIWPYGVSCSVATVDPLLYMYVMMTAKFVNAYTFLFLNRFSSMRAQNLRIAKARALTKLNFWSGSEQLLPIFEVFLLITVVTCFSPIFFKLETKKVMAKSRALTIRFLKRLYFSIFSLSAGGLFVSWWGSFKVGRPCQGVNFFMEIFKLHPHVARSSLPTPHCGSTKVL